MSPVDGGKQFEFVSSGQNCQIGPPLNQNYLVGLTKSKLSTSTRTGNLYETAFCIPLDAAMASGIWQHSMRR